MSATKPKAKVRVKPSDNPQNVTDQAWYYEGKGSIDVYISNTPSGSACVSAKIPWSMILRSLARCKPGLAPKPAGKVRRGERKARGL